jgi:hypothetical protein
MVAWLSAHCTLISLLPLHRNDDGRSLIPNEPAMIDADPEADFLTWIHYDLLDSSRITESYSAAWNNAMNSEAEDKAFVVDFNKLPPMFPTHRHHPVFWEKLGRVIGTFGFLEEVLGKAIFAFTATTPYNKNEIEAAFERWLPTLEKALVDPLGGLIDAYGKAVRSNSAATVESLDELLAELRNASGIRNVLCHGSGQPPKRTSESPSPCLTFSEPESGLSA